MVTRVTLTPADVNTALANAKAEKASQPANAWMAETKASTPFNGSVVNGELRGQRASLRNADHVGSSETVDDSVIQLGSMTVTREVALAQGLVKEVNGELVATNEAAAVVQQKAAADAEHAETVSEATDIAKAHNDALDYMEAEYGPAAVSEACEDIIATGDWESYADLPAAVVIGYAHQAETMAKEAGLDNLDLMSISLDEDQQERARRALITGDQNTFKNLARAAIHQIGQLATDEDFIAEIEEAGCRVLGTGHNAQLVFDDGSMMSLAEALRSGIIRGDY